MALITFNDKVALDPQPSVADENKVSDSDMNEIKSVVNENASRVIWTGTLYGTETTTLTGVLNKLKIYARSRNDSIIYEIDLTGEEYYTNYGAGQVVSYDTASSLEYYISESSYVRSTGVFTHVRTGYFNISNGTYTNRNKNQGAYSGYYVYKIETSN